MTEVKNKGDVKAVEVKETKACPDAVGKFHACPCCNNIYNPKERLPTVLHGCGHLSCLQCVVRNAKKGTEENTNVSTCTKCLKPSLFSGPVINESKEFVGDRLNIVRSIERKEALSRVQQKTKHFCQEDTDGKCSKEATEYCTNCKVTICAVCRDVHHAVKPGRHPKRVVPIAKMPESPQECSLHLHIVDEAAPCIFYCKTCNVAICTHCRDPLMEGTHQNHDIDLLRRVAAERRAAVAAFEEKKLLPCNAKLAAQVVSCSTKIDDVVKNAEVAKKNAARRRQQDVENFHAMMKLREERENDLIDQCRDRNIAQFQTDGAAATSKLIDGLTALQALSDCKRKDDVTYMDVHRNVYDQCIAAVDQGTPIADKVVTSAAIPVIENPLEEQAIGAQSRSATIDGVVTVIPMLSKRQLLSSRSFSLSAVDAGNDVEYSWFVRPADAGEQARAPCGTGRSVVIANLKPDTAYLVGCQTKTTSGGVSPVREFAFRTTMCPQWAEAPEFKIEGDKTVCTKVDASGTAVIVSHELKVEKHFSVAVRVDMPDDKCIVSVAGLPNKSDAPYFESTGNVFCKNKWHPYNAERLRSGSVVGIHHNLETNELEFSVDGVKRGVAFFGLPKETSFRLIAECNAPGCVLTVL